jgi:hypothetical protein
MLHLPTEELCIISILLEEEQEQEENVQSSEKR